MASKGQTGSLDKTQNAGDNETEDKGDNETEDKEKKSILVQDRQKVSLGKQPFRNELNGEAVRKYNHSSHYLSYEGP